MDSHWLLHHTYLKIYLPCTSYYCTMQGSEWQPWVGVLRGARQLSNRSDTAEVWLVKGQEYILLNH